MSAEKDDEQNKPKTTISYYGKKLYYTDSEAVRKKPMKNKTPEYKYEDIKASDMD